MSTVATAVATAFGGDTATHPAASGRRRRCPPQRHGICGGGSGSRRRISASARIGHVPTHVHGRSRIASSQCPELRSSAFHWLPVALRSSSGRHGIVLEAVELQFYSSAAAAAAAAATAAASAAIAVGWWAG